MKNLFTKKVAAYLFSGFIVLFLATVGFVYIQLKDIQNIKAMVTEKIEELTGRNVIIDKADLNFEKGISIRLQNLSIDARSGKGHDLLVKSAWCVVKIWPLLKKEIEIKKFILDEVSIELVRDKQGNLNFGDPLRWLMEPPSSKLFKVLGASFIHQLSISNSDVRFRDYYNTSDAHPISLSMNHINLNIDKRFFKNIFSFNLSGEIPNEFQDATFEVSGAVDDMKNEIGNQIIPVQGKIKVHQFNVAEIKPYLGNIFSAVPNDIHLSLESDFSGNLGSSLRSKGQFKYLKAIAGKKLTLRSLDTQNSGEIEYSLTLNNDSIEIEDFKIRSGLNKVSGNGKLTSFKSKDPKISFLIKTSEFKTGETRNNFPLVFLPESFHKKINATIDNGTLEVKYLKYDGLLKQLQDLDLKESNNHLAAKIGFIKTDWHSPFPQLKKVTGFFEYKNNEGYIEIKEARYKGLPITNIRGTIKDVINNPLADLSIESELDLRRLSHALKKAIAGKSFKNILDDYQKVAGKGLLEGKLTGPLKEVEKLSIVAAISTKNASFYDAYLQSPIRNFNGEIYFNHVSAENKKLSKSPVPIVEGKNLSGKFGNSEFYNMHGKILRQGENIVQEMKAVYRLNATELPKIIADIDFAGPEFTLFKEAKFNQGDVEVQYRSFMDLDKPKEKKSWGKIKLTDITIKHPSGFQPLVNLTGRISFGDERINIDKIQGWYGGSPITLSGQLTPKSKSLIDFDVSLKSTSWTQDDFENIPYLQSLKFVGSLNSEISLAGNRDSFTFKNKFDLTQAAYKFQDVIHKKENNPNKIELEGVYSKNEGIALDRFNFFLDSNSFTGTANIKNLSDPTYLIKINGIGFKANTLGSLMNIFSNNTSGKIDFNVVGEGNLNRLEDSFFKGSAILKNLVFKWEDRKNPLTLSANVRFSGDTYDLRSGQMESGRSKILFRGKYKNEKQPELLLKLTGETLIVDDFISNKKDKSETNLKDLFEQSNLLSKGKSKISVDLEQLDFKWITLRGVSGNFRLKDREILFNKFRIGSNNPIKIIGKLSVKDPESIRFETKLKANEIEAEDFLAMFGGHFKGGLTGKFKKLQLSAKSRGRKISENIRTLSGRLSFGLTNGAIDTKQLKLGLFDLFDLETSPKQKEKTEKDEGPTDFENISGDFVYIGGIAETENFIYETDQRKSAIVGKFDLNNLEMDTVVGVAHMPGLDKLLNQIPVFGKILTAGDEGSLIKAYYDVKGSFEEPIVTLVPLTSLGKKFMGLFKSIIQTPEEILNLPEKVGTQLTD
jgi:uncharacterized protein involved in outer membrane biogenesis